MMEESQFEVGCEVRLKGVDGPTMVVMGTDANAPETVLCGWFNKDGKLERESFPKAACDCPSQGKKSAKSESEPAKSVPAASGKDIKTGK